MKTAPLSDVKARLSAYVAECEKEGPVVITRDGKPAAVLLAPRDPEDLERLLLSRSPRFQAMLDRSRRSVREGRVLTEAAFWKEVKRRARRRKGA
jgi:prevent-host-death family protein